MDSAIAKALQLQHEPVAILWSDQKPVGALQFKTGRWGCVMWPFAKAAKGKTAVFDRQTFGCNGGGVGLGFGNKFVNAPGGIEGFSYFLSTGIESCENPEMFASLIENIQRPEQADILRKGERLWKTPELVKKFIEELPLIDIPAEYVIFKPLSQLKEGEEPIVVVFVASPTQISGLVTLANYRREGVDNVIVRAGAGCHQIGIFAYKEAKLESPRAILGLTDPAARKNIRKMVGGDVFTFAVPYRMFLEMEEDVEESFLKGALWKGLVEPE